MPLEDRITFMKNLLVQMIRLEPQFVDAVVKELGRL